MLHQDFITGALSQLDCSADFLCAVAEISPKKLSNFMRDIKPLNGHEIMRLMKIVEELKALAEDAKPFVLAFRNPKYIRSLIDQRRSGVRFVPQIVPEGTDAENSFDSKR